jgi:hypothetical protein
VLPVVCSRSPAVSCAGFETLFGRPKFLPFCIELDDCL